MRTRKEIEREAYNPSYAIMSGGDDDVSDAVLEAEMRKDVAISIELALDMRDLLNEILTNLKEDSQNHNG